MSDRSVSGKGHGPLEQRQPMYSIQWYDKDSMRKLGTPEGVFYTEDKARETALNEEVMRSFQDFPPRHFEIVRA